MSIEIHIFVMHSIFQERGNLPIVDRHFLCLVLSIRRFRTPVWSVNAPTALRGEVQRERRNRSFSALIKSQIWIKINKLKRYITPKVAL